MDYIKLENDNIFIHDKPVESFGFILSTHNETASLYKYGDGSLLQDIYKTTLPLNDVLKLVLFIFNDEYSKSDQVKIVSYLSNHTLSVKSFAIAKAIKENNVKKLKQTFDEILSN